MKKLLVVLMSLVIVVIGLLGPAMAPPSIGMDEAVEILIDEVIQPETLDRDIVAYMLTEPLEDGDEVTTEIGEGICNVTEDIYFIFVDDYPTMFFGHPVRFVFIKVATGEHEVGNGTWPPLVNGMSIIRLEELGQVELLRFYSTSAKPNPVTGISSTAPQGDYGDAPDGQEAYWWAPSVDGPVVGGFPTLYDTTNSIFGDPGAHCLNTGEEMLGVSVSREVDATDPADPDGVPNLVDADSDEWNFVEIDISTTPASARLIFDVTVALGAPDVVRYINVLVDFDQNGGWSGIANGKEWAVVNHPVNVPPGTTQMITTPSFDWGNGLVLPSPVWMRISLTRTEVDETKFTPAAGGWDGSGQFEHGEVEDIVVGSWGGGYGKSSVLPWVGPAGRRPAQPPPPPCPDPGKLPKWAPCPTPVKNYALVINAGDHYGDTHAKQAADDIKRILTNQAYDDGVPSLGPADGTNTKAKIKEEIGKLGGKVNCPDRVFIYIVGHGRERDPPNYPSGGISLKDANGKTKEVLEPEDLAEYLCQIEPCDDEPCDTPDKTICVCVVIESCFAENFHDRCPDKKCEIIVTSSDENHGARFGTDGTGGEFTDRWVEALCNAAKADKNGDEIVDCKEAFDYAKNNIKTPQQNPKTKGECCDCCCPRRCIGGFMKLVNISADEPTLLAPYVGLGLTIVVATVAAAIHLKRVSRRKEKH